MATCPNSKLEKVQGRQHGPFTVGVLTYHSVLEMHSNIALGQLKSLWENVKVGMRVSSGREQKFHKKSWPFIKNGIIMMKS